jgi:predicted dehydrogenase
MDPKETKPTAGGATRRDFIRKTATAAAAVAAVNVFRTPIYGQNTPPSANVKGANDRIAIGYIGIGGQPSDCPGMGLGHVKMQKGKASELNITQAAVCDLWDVRNDIAKKAIDTSDVTSYTDYRKILERKDIDAVLIATHDPWHARCSIEAMQAGKHVYCEKPMTRYLGEAFEVYDAVKRTGKVFQVGSQGTSAEGWHKAAEIVKSGKLGKLVWARGAYLRNNPTGEWNYRIVDGAENIDWNAWLGPVKKRPDKFDGDHYFRWRKYYPYCSGLLGDLVPHRLHPLMLATGNPQFPKRVVCVGTKNIESDKQKPNAHMRDVPEYVQLTAEFPDGFLLSVNSSSVSGKVPGFSIFGHDGTLDVADPGNALQMTPERHKAEETESISLKGLQHEDQVVHAKNWLDCIRSGGIPNGNIDLAIKVQTVISLSEMSDRLGIVCFFDEKTRKISDGSGKEVKPITYGTLPLS